MNSIIFRTATHIVTSLMLLFSLYLLWRGHNNSGGGFIGALVAVIAYALLVFAESPAYVRKRLVLKPRNIAVLGLSLIMISGFIGLLVGQSFLAGIWIKDVLPIGTPVLFDIGVYLGVLGSILAILLRLNEVLD